MKYLVLVLSVVMFFSCGQQADTPAAPEKVVTPEATTEAPAEEATPAVEETAPTEEIAPADETGAALDAGLQGEDLAQIQAILAVADKMDGTEDHKVFKCAGCKLNMEGSADHVHEVAGFELYHCSENCKNTFLEASTDNILALQARVNK